MMDHILSLLNETESSRPDTENGKDKEKVEEDFDIDNSEDESIDLDIESEGNANIDGHLENVSGEDSNTSSYSHRMEISQNRIEVNWENSTKHPVSPCE
jgi:hypothetical protein